MAVSKVDNGNTGRADDQTRVLSWIEQLTPFWPQVTFDDLPFYCDTQLDTNGTKGLLISGPSRNGNHLVHSLLDGHSQLPRIPGEDGVLNALFDRFAADFHTTDARLRSSGTAAFLRSLSGRGIEDKWAEVAQSDTASDTSSSTLWSGMFFGKGHENFVHDYQDTQVAIDYSAYATVLDSFLTEQTSPSCLHDLNVRYMQALARLDPAYNSRVTGFDCYDGIAFGSGARLPLQYMFAHGDYMMCVAPIRPFETYYFSFAKGFFDTTDIRPDILQEAWEHWFHKVTDYLIIKRAFPDRLCLVNFVELIADTEATMRRVCDFLGLGFEEACLTPTVLGLPTKGNSSHPKTEAHRGRVYDAPLRQSLPEEHMPKGYPDYWRAVEALSV